MGLPIALAVIIIAALMIVLYGGRIGDAIAVGFGYPGSLTLIWRLV
jgi:hypothetical protein